MNPRQEKQLMKKTIIAALKRDGSADIRVLASSLRLQTGFASKVIKQMFDDLENVGYIVVLNDTAKLTEEGERSFGEL